MVQVNTQLTPKEYINFNFSHIFSQWPIRGLLGIFGFVAFMSVLGFFLNLLTEEVEVQPFEQLMPVPIILGLFGLFCWSIYAQSNRNYKSNNAMHEPIVYTFSDAGMHVKGQSFESDLNWSVIHQVKETKKLFLFYQNNLAANLIPKTDFSSKEQISALRDLITAQTNLKYKLRKD